MKGDHVTDPGNELVRFARRTHCDTRSNGDVYITGAAFLWSKVSPSDQGLSVNWLNRFPGDQSSQLAAVRSVMHMSPNASDRLALLKIGMTAEYLRRNAGISMAVIEDPTPPNPPRYPHEDVSHAVIAGLPDSTLDSVNADLVGDLIADNCVLSSILARAPKV